MFSNRGGSGIISSRLKRKSKASGDAPASDDPAPGTAASIKPGFNQQGSWVAGGMPAPPSGVVAQVQAKKVQVARENKSAVQIQGKIRQKNAKAEVAQKKQLHAENNAATRIQAIKRGQKARAEIQGLKGEEYEEAPPNALQKCTAGMAEWFSSMMAKCPCTQHKKLDEQGMLKHLMPKHKEITLSKELETKLRELFGKMDKDNDQILSKAEVSASPPSPRPGPATQQPRNPATPRTLIQTCSRTPSTALTYDDHTCPAILARRRLSSGAKTLPRSMRRRCSTR